MLANILRCSVVCILFLTITQGSPVSVEAPNTLDDAIRQKKTEEILKYMNASVDPCDDFYEYTCGNYAAINPAVTTPSTGFFETLVTEFENKLKSVLTSDDDDTDTAFDKTMKRFYKSCINLPSLKNNYSEKLQEIIGEFGQMPALVGDEWRENDFDWVRTVAEIAYKYNIYMIAYFMPIPDLKNHAVSRLALTDAHFDLPMSTYVDKQHAAIIERNTLELAALLHQIVGVEHKLAYPTAKGVMDFDTVLAKAMFDHVHRPILDVYTLHTTDEVQEKYSADLDFKQLLNTSLGSIPDLKVYIDKLYLEAVIDAMKSTPKRTVANYIFTKLISPFAIHVPLDTKELENECLSRMKNYFHRNLDNMVYRKYNAKATEEGITQMWVNIKSAFQNIMDSPRLNWISEDTRQHALVKSNAISLRIQSYEEENSATDLGQLKLDDHDFVGTLKSILAAMAAQKKNIDYSVPQPIEDGEEVSMTPSYNRLKNTISIPVSALQPNYAWSASFPNAFNFAVLGFLLSHEVLHGYDDKGITFDAQGNIRKWWDDKSLAEFKDRTKCFNDQYKQYIFDGKHLPEAPNQNENTADNGGIRLAYDAYLKWYETAEATKRDMSSETLNSLNYNHKQLFFLSYGHLWCSDVHPQVKKLMLTADTHVPKPFRVVGTLSNFDQFAKVFNCPAGSPMNPVNKCEIY